MILKEAAFKSGMHAGHQLSSISERAKWSWLRWRSSSAMAWRSSAANSSSSPGMRPLSRGDPASAASWSGRSRSPDKASRAACRFLPLHVQDEQDAVVTTREVFQQQALSACCCIYRTC